MNIYTKPSHPHFRGVPSFYRGVCRDAAHRINRYDYAVAGETLAYHTREMIVPGDEPEQANEKRIAELENLLDAYDEDGIWRWFRREFPACMSLIPRSRKRKFLDGVFSACEAGVPW